MACKYLLWQCTLLATYDNIFKPKNQTPQLDVVGWRRGGVSSLLFMLLSHDRPLDDIGHSSRSHTDSYLDSAMPGKQVVGPVMPVVDNSPISKNRMIPEILEKGTMMKKISAGKEKKVLVQIDPDQGTIKIRKSTDNNLRISTALSTFELDK